MLLLTSTKPRISWSVLRDPVAPAGPSAARLWKTWDSMALKKAWNIYRYKDRYIYRQNLDIIHTLYIYIHL